MRAAEEEGVTYFTTIGFFPQVEEQERKRFSEFTSNRIRLNKILIFENLLLVLSL